MSAATTVGEAVYRRAGPGVCRGAPTSVWSQLALCDWRRRGGDSLGLAQLPCYPSASGFSSGTVPRVQTLTPLDAQTLLVTGLQVREEKCFQVAV